MAEKQEYDYIVVGAGSAGAIVAAKLSDDPRASVLLIEAGPDDTSHWTKVPLGFGKVLFDQRYMWYHKTGAEPGLDGRILDLPHGKLVGGSSAINGLQYARGIPFDYDNWDRMGAIGWSFDEVLPVFKRMERFHSGASAHHGGRGPIGVEPVRWHTELADAFIDAANALGVPRNSDPNGPLNEGVGYVNLSAWRARRSSTSQTYLKNARRRGNLRVVSEAFATRILFEGRQACGIRYEQAGAVHEAKARAEVILSLGALQTPQLLQISGVGPGALLQENGIDPVIERAGVGDNLIDHVHVGVACRSQSKDTVNAIMASRLAKLLHGLDYYVGRRRGLLTMGASQAGGFLRTSPEQPGPDIQFGLTCFLPDPVDMWKLAKGSGFGIGSYFTRPRSRGHVRIASPTMRDAPDILCNYLTHNDDQAAALRGLKFIRKLMHTAPLSRYNVGEVIPGQQYHTDDELLAYARSACGTAFHFCGTARMGTDDNAVVDPKLRVRGLGRLRIADASVMPDIVSGNTNAASMLIGERAADFIVSRN